MLRIVVNFTVLVFYFKLNKKLCTSTKKLKKRKRKRKLGVIWFLLPASYAFDSSDLVPQRRQKYCCVFVAMNISITSAELLMLRLNKVRDMLH